MLHAWMDKLRVTPLKRRIYLAIMMCVFAVAYAGQAVVAPAEGHAKPFKFFALFSDPDFSSLERVCLMVVLGIAIAGLGYALLLMRQVNAADQGTKRMQEIAAAVREGSNAYLAAQFRKIGPLIIIITVVLWFTVTGDKVFAFGRAGAFLMGSLFSWAVGFVGMRLATTGNLRVAAAAKHSYGEAMQLGYRTGTVTGMLTDGLGLLGGTLIFLLYGVHAYEALLGFGFGGTLLALFMRVGGGIYTKAADVGADLVGKIEKDIPEDDPRNAATIADNVGDNVGDCAGMAADIFESYEVTIVAAMILGMASFGHKGVIFPLLVRGIGVLGSIISTYTVKAGPEDTSDTALKSVHRGFWIGSIISVVGFFVLGYFYLHFDANYMATNPMAAAGFPGHDPKFLPAWANFGVAGLDMRPAITCLIGVFLAVALNKVTSYYTHTTHAPVKGLARACTTGHATNIIEGFALGYESTVAMLVVIVVALFLSVLTYAGTPPMFVAYGVAMTGIGMLTLTGNTISMDVFGPVADNANGIGEMGFDKDEMEKEKPGSYKRARQILADLDAVGNTTKAETKGIAIGSAVIAAVSLFSSFIAVIAVGSEDKIAQMSIEEYRKHAGLLTVADPKVFIGFLIGGAVPFLFSSQLIRAVGRAAYYIVIECRAQFRDAAIWAGTKKPDYGRVVDICTSTAQKELVGPGLLAITAPLMVGLFLGPYALGGFLAGMILVGQLLAVFMANAGGAWDNAKKMIEDGLYGGKGSEAHKASVTGDTVGDPLKDTAGPALNPLIKVMNMVSLLALGVVMKFTIFPVEGMTSLKLGGLVGGLICAGLIGWAVAKSKQETPGLVSEEEAK
ncbi:sodium-translocating pyrophosphatase [Mesoterricola sediminis]|uniref:K(+)-insensitive pyrophosphate-energized proton pump n=1 Tax=Mesoterricola sediminis TaxID=2927980 RepID=A0AA48GVE6_9BACT|nr:sodium-translocating pyrophosphatase [Mesoterricola sediminis]BDU76979.1 K(+)-insensitive pyrophosphate-energized proton pump [Mesoterricola sediminis]